MILPKNSPPVREAHTSQGVLEYRLHYGVAAHLKTFAVTDHVDAQLRRIGVCGVEFGVRRDVNVLSDIDGRAGIRQDSQFGLTAGFEPLLQQKRNMPFNEEHRLARHIDPIEVAIRFDSLNILAPHLKGGFA